MSIGRYAIFGWLIIVGLLASAGAALALTPAEQDAQNKLQAELIKVEAEIAAQTKLLQSKQSETASIQRDIDILTAQISRAKLNIKAKEIQIKQLGTDISKKQITILTLSERITREQASLAELLRKTREIDDISMPEVVLEGETFSKFFVDLDSFYAVQQALHQSFGVIRGTKAQTEQEKASLTKRRNQEIDARAAIEKEKRSIEANEKEKKRLLTLSKGQENNYKAVIAEREQQRQAIRSALFRLQGTTAISFGEALDHANFVASKIGIRPAFLLAIITQESNLGQNIGTCNRAGDPPEKGWKEIMKPTRDYEPYLAITAELGLDPNTMPLSCPYKGGYGGAMGPAQFIPSTWLGMKNRISAITGSNPPNPWNPRDAFSASGAYLADLGADAKTYTAERTAALKYYAGGNWSKPANAFYGDGVMKIATGYQAQIDILQQN
ncbi:MAG: lytic murein transglycosylase [bacterium]|nr:lytic murein transglycosylase [bacterium]